jgi:hypothetical protein
VRKLLLITIAGPVSLNDNIGKTATDLHRSIAAIRVDNDDLIAPLEAVQASFNVFFLIEANDDGRDAHGGGFR